MNNKGFTLVELLATITIIGIITAFAFPAISSLKSENDTKEYEAYEKTMIYAAKVYYENHRTATIVYETTLVDAKLLKKINKKNVNCNGSYIEINNGKYIPHLTCKKYKANGQFLKEMYKSS